MLFSLFIQAISSQKKFFKFFLPKTSNGVNFLSNSPHKTKKFGEILGKEILKTKKKKKALVLGLKGDLGGGKTTFLQGLAKGLGIKQRITSPTFVIIRKYKISNFQCAKKAKISSSASFCYNKTQLPIFNYFYHIDCYRLQKPKEILDLGFKEIVSNPQNIAAIEWADRIKKILPRDTLILKFKFINQNTREIKCDIIKTKRGMGPFNFLKKFKKKNARVFLYC